MAYVLRSIHPAVFRGLTILSLRSLPMNVSAAAAAIAGLLSVEVSSVSAQGVNHAQAHRSP